MDLYVHHSSAYPLAQEHITLIVMTSDPYQNYVVWLEILLYTHSPT